MKWNVHSCPLIPYILNVQAAREADCTEILFNNVFRRTISNYEWASLLLLAVTQSLRCYVNKYILFMYGNAHVTFFFFFFSFLFVIIMTPVEMFMLDVYASWKLMIHSPSCMVYDKKVGHCWKPSTSPEEFPNSLNDIYILIELSHG